MSKDVTAASGAVITVSLSANPTTGFSWGEKAEISDTEVLSQTSHEIIGPSGTHVVGAPSTEVWTFKALKAGKSTALFSYSRPWEGGEKNVQTFKLNVTVK